MKIQNSQGKSMSLEEVANLPVPKAEGDGDTAEEMLVIEPSATSVAVPARPSLLVEMDVNSNLKPRILAHVGRMRAWDLRKLDIEMRARFSASLDVLAESFGALEDCLMALAQLGFEAKTTPATRIASKLAVGTPVTLRADIRATFAPIYTDEQLDSLTVVRTTDTHVQLMAGDSSNIGLVRIIHVDLKQ
jgi:hypothetical protein